MGVEMLVWIFFGLCLVGWWVWWWLYEVVVYCVDVVIIVGGEFILELNVVVDGISEFLECIVVQVGSGGMLLLFEDDDILYLYVIDLGFFEVGGWMVCCDECGVIWLYWYGKGVVVLCGGVIELLLVMVC